MKNPYMQDFSVENPIFHTQDLCLRTLDTNLICKKMCAEMRINMIRKIVHIDEEKCNGCGACANACHEDAIAMVDGKARLIKDDYCDGLGDCLPACPMDAIKIIEREANDYDEGAVKARIAAKKIAENTKKNGSPVHVCPGSMARSLQHREDEKTPCSSNDNSQAASNNGFKPVSRLNQWPVQIKLVPPKAPYFDGANLLVAADCTAYAYANFHEDFIKNHITLVGCPKLDDIDYSEKLTEIIKNNDIKSVKIVRMEVPCCGGLQNAVVNALKNSGKMIPWQVVTISCDGRILEQ